MRLFQSPELEPAAGEDLHVWALRILPQVVAAVVAGALGEALAAESGVLSPEPGGGYVFGVRLVPLALDAPEGSVS